MADPPRTEALARQARGSDPASMAALVPRLAPALMAWARLRVRPRLGAIATPEDLVQEVWLRAVVALPSFDPDRCSFRAWLFRVAKNVLHEVQRDLLRRRVHGGGSGRTSVLRALQEVPADVTSVTGRVARDEGVATFLARVAELDELDRRLVVHCGLEDMTQREAAAMLGLSHEATMKRWQRLRARMRGWPLPAELVAGQ